MSITDLTGTLGNTIHSNVDYTKINATLRPFRNPQKSYKIKPGREITLHASNLI